MKICGCVTGPPPFGICNACGAVGSHYRGPETVPTNPPLQPGKVEFWPQPMTAEEIRRIVREELERSKYGD